MKKIIFSLTLLPLLALAQVPTQSQNYVKTLAYKDATQTTDATKANAQVTYVDGLGRPVQQIAGKMSANGKDIITHIEYDSYSRQPREYLPYEASGAALQFDDAAFSNTLQFYSSSYYENTPNPYSEKVFEASPLNRVLKQGAPGEAWQVAANGGADHSVKFDYQTNAEQELRYLRAQATWNASSKIYDIAFFDEGYAAPHQFYKTITKDENWESGINNTIEEFKNKEGQVVLKRTYNNNREHDTYYVYDQFGNLTYVLPPLAEGQLDEGLCYYYKYDGRNRMVEKKLPGKQWEYIVYDALDRVVATGPVNSPFSTGQEGWLYNFYDASGRQCMNGWYPEQGINTAARQAQQDTAGATVINVAVGQSTIDGIITGYAQPWLPSGFKLLSINYYDNYTWPGAAAPTANTLIEGQNILLTVRGLPTGTWVRVLTAPTENLAEISYTWYDKKARAVYSAVSNYLGGYTNVSTLMDFDGTPLYTITTHKRTAADSELVVKDMFTYTSEDRLLSHTHKINNDPVQLLAYNSYDALGQLQTKSVGGTDVTGSTPLQEVNYTYNIRGWLKGINDVNDLNADKEDLFAFKINYNDAIDETVDQQVKQLYNGNIAETYWRSQSDNVLRKYGYKYDQLNRLLNAFYQKPQNTVQLTNSYNESLTYDMNGNIQTLVRTGDYDDNVYAIEIDNLTYSYDTTQKNRLVKVEDTESNNPSGFKDSPDNDIDDYTYDANGNMLTDRNKGITSITYNHLDLPVEIVFNNNENTKINYLYNAVGQKVGKAVTTLPVIPGQLILPETVYTDYLSGFQYTKILLQLFPTAEGYVDVTKVLETISYSYVFQYKDHLGNIRMNYALDPESNVLKIKEENHYYPFGLKHANYNGEYLEFQEQNAGLRLLAKPPFGTPNDKVSYNYKYNGKELQDELGLNMYDYGARNYDPALGRWMNIDPKAEQMRRWSPYNYCFNNPLRFTDPDGMSPDGDYYNRSGEWLGTDHKVDNKAYVVDEGTYRKTDTGYNIGNDGIHELSIGNDELNLRASLSTLKQTEAGSANEPLDYNSWNHGDNFTDKPYTEENKAEYANHPGANGKNGTAAGAYQALERFYSGDDFSPKSQDKATVNNMTTKSFEAAKTGDAATFKTTTQARWTSLKHFTTGALQKIINTYRAEEIKGNSGIATPVGDLVKTRN